MYVRCYYILTALLGKSRFAPEAHDKCSLRSNWGLRVLDLIHSVFRFKQYNLILFKWLKQESVLEDSLKVKFGFFANDS